MVVSVVSSLSEPSAQYQLVAELDDLFKEMAWDTGVKVVVLGGNIGESFSEGWKCTKTVSKDKVGPDGRLVNITEPIVRMDRPVIAAMNGYVLGQSLELVLACDIRIGSEECWFGFPHVMDGLLPQDGGTQRLPRLVGKGKALEMILTGNFIDAQEAYRIGLLNKVVPAHRVMDVAVGLAKEMASKGPIALRYAKEAIHKGMDMTLEQGLRLEADLYLLLHTTEDRTEGIKAFQERRSPKFKGE